MRPVVLVPGAAVWDGGVASPALARRANHAAHLYHAGKTGHIIACGAVGKHPPSEARVIRDICTGLGVPAAAISLEERSTNTIGNIRFSLPFLEQLGSTTVIIATDAYHAPRALRIARKLGLTATADCPPSRTGSRRLRYKALLREALATLAYAAGIKKG
jgi:uncharacterized SAM-binding protein YcdF (DUF218 family)